MQEFDTDEARGARPTRRHWVIRVLIVSLILVAIAWYFSETVTS